MKAFPAFYQRQTFCTKSISMNFQNLVRKIKDLRLRERTENAECGGSHIAGTEYQSPNQFLMLNTNPNEFCKKNPSFKRYFIFVKF